MKRWFLAGMVFGFVFLGALRAQARQDTVPGSRFTSARAAGMGDSAAPIADDVGSALFNNPAEFGKIKKAQLEPINFSFFGNTNYLSGFGATNGYKATSLSSYQSALAENPGRFSNVGASLFSGFGTRGFGLGVLTQSSVGAAVDSSGNIRYRSLYQFIPAVGGAIRLAQGIVRLGYSAQWVHQASGDVSLPAGSSPVGYNQQLRQGSGFSHTAAFALTLPMAYLPSFNLIARNISTLKFSGSSIVPFAKNSPGAPEAEPMTMDASFSLQPKLGASSFFNWVVTLRDMSNQSGISMLGRAATGVELVLRDTLFVRGGWASGYPTAGIALRAGRGEIAAAWYTEELGKSYHAQPDTRFLFQFSMRLF